MFRFLFLVALAFGGVALDAAQADAARVVVRGGRGRAVVRVRRAVVVAPRVVVRRRAIIVAPVRRGFFFIR